ncbi:unnamed protein product [Agarophyton chilense]|eukprot:gb/GEZJ01001091.1/.p1 GENE.gb/GEZJ01001091.1/~~gb/GEZJ01001091.1/.p1  ORF type:complete len:604 (-),score=70.50 gb/GEZJ01001091.1/:1323-3134(-)
MRSEYQLFVLFLFASSSLAALSWNKVSVSGSYPGRGETALSLCGGDKICLLGGRGANRVHILNTQTRQWQPAKSNSLEMHHFQAFQGPDKCVWVAGAWTGAFPAESTVDSIWRYCPDTDQWHKDVDIDRPRGSGGAFFYNGKVYLVTGNVGGHREGAKVVPWFDSYDPATGKWERLPDMPNPRDHCNAVVKDNKVYVTGGRRSTSDFPEFFDDTVAEVDVYDFASRKWSTLTGFSRPRGGTASAVLDGAIYIMGGEGDNRAWTEVDVLNGASFQPGPSLPEPRHGTGIVSCNGAVWIAGGERVIGSGSPATSTYALYDGDEVPVCRSGSESSATTAAPTVTTDASTVSTDAPATQDPTPVPSSSNSAPPEETEDKPSAPNDTASGAVGADEIDVSSTPSKTPKPLAEESATVESSTENSSNNAACFPSDATVELDDGTVKTMSSLRIGDRVKVAHPKEYSEVYFFSHNHADKQSDFVNIKTSLDDAALTLSPGHFMYANGALVEASRVVVGDKVSVSHDSKIAEVTQVSRIKAKGLHNPHTVHGDIIVNGVVASTLTSTLHPSLAKFILTPLKMVYRILQTRESMETFNKAVLRTLDVTYWRN